MSSRKRVYKMVIYVQQFSPIEQKNGKTKHQIEHQAGLRLLTIGLAQEYKIMVSDIEKEITPGFKGKPFLHNNPEIFFNISHGGTMAACGLDGSPLGVDVEEIRPVKPALWKKVLTEEERIYLKQYRSTEQEREFFRIWTLKESYAKAIGLGLALDFTSLSCHLTSEKKPFSGCPQESIQRVLGKRIPEDPGKGEERFWMDEVAVKRFLHEGCQEETGRKKEEEEWKNQQKTGGEKGGSWRFFQAVLEERFVISCCCKLPFL